jgi:hypothetical protein
MPASEAEPAVHTATRPVTAALQGSHHQRVKSKTSSPWQDVPYQQDLIPQNGEWFADVFVNWANGTLADNAQGDAIDAWMNAHMTDWIEMGLAADPSAKR